jgi:hypothetical protein
VASIDRTPAAKAAALMENVRRTPMAHGRLRDAKESLRWNIARTIEDSGVPQRLASRIAFQLVFKFGPAAVGDRRTWHALGELLRRDVERLKNHLGLVERQIVVALPKLSAQQIEDILEELRTADPTIARTILNSALDAAEPGTAARRYLAEFHAVVREFRNIVPGIARTFANATFMAHAPREPSGVLPSPTSPFGSGVTPSVLSTPVGFDASVDGWATPGTWTNCSSTSKGGNSISGGPSTKTVM